MKAQSKDESIIYVNYSPYENSGKILDFLLDNFKYVFLFSLSFHGLKSQKSKHKLYIYQNGRLIDEKPLFQIPVPVKFFFLLLPLRSILTLSQIIIHSFILKNKYKKLDYYFTVNAFSAWIGGLMRGFKMVDKTIFWVWDYYPPFHDSKIIVLMRQLYWQFDKISSYSDRVAYVNQRLIDLRKDMGVLSKDVKYLVVPIGTDKSEVSLKVKKEVVIGFIGVLKKSHGLDLIFDNANNLVKNFPKARFEIIGSGPDEEYFKKRAKKSPIRTTFHGFLEGEIFKKVLGECTIGLATYIPDKSNVSHYGDPGKVKIYLSLGIPVIMTDVMEFSNTVNKVGAGVVISYSRKHEIVNAIKKIINNYVSYQKNAVRLSNKFYYKKIYPKMFFD